MYNHDVEELHPLVSIGTPVHITKTAQNNPKFNNPVSQPLPDKLSQSTLAPSNKTNQSSNNSTNYVVKAGDSLWKIANKHNIPLKKLISYNQLSNPEIIHPGQTIKIPGNKKQ